MVVDFTVFFSYVIFPCYVGYKFCMVVAWSPDLFINERINLLSDQLILF